MKSYLIHGVPMAIQQDGWWLNGPPRGKGQDAGAEQGQPQTSRLWLLLGLIALGDYLVWQVVPGLSLAIFGASLVLAALYLVPDTFSRKRAALVGGLGLLSLLPLIELVQPLSLLIAGLGVTVALVILAGVGGHQLLHASLRLWPLGIAATGFEARRIGKSRHGQEAKANLQRALRLWLVPVVMGLVFVVLLLAANPIAARWLDGVSRASVDLPTPMRMVFWACLIPIAWTVLSLPMIRHRLRLAPSARAFGPLPEGMINAGSTSRALVLFNAVFAVQTMMDVFYLYGGAALPQGMTYAQYAHRGAYPLLVTALLAGGFALLTRRWTDGNAVLRMLLLLWVAQNVALVISSLVRLDLYVEIYGLTRLRMAAAIWMGLVATGLVLILWQVWKGHRSGWLLLRIGAIAAVALYLCSFASFDARIARHNLSGTVPFDPVYLCRLGESAKPAIRRFERARGHAVCTSEVRRDIQMQGWSVPPLKVSAPKDWREWGFRNARVRHTLARLNPEVNP